MTMSYGNDQFNEELMHYGVLGMKWGVRRYERAANASSRDAANLRKHGYTAEAAAVQKVANKQRQKALALQRKRVSKAYKKASIAGDRDLAKQYNSMYVKAYNKAADKMNNGGIERFNKAQEKKYGKNYSQRAGYESDYSALFNKELKTFMNKSLADFRLSNKHYQKADALVKEYGMTKWDDLARSNQEAVDQLVMKHKDRG